VGFAGKRVPVITPVPVTEKKSVHCASIWKTIAKVIGYVIALVLVTLVGIGIGTALGPGSYSGSITEHIVSEGDSIWQLAANVDTTISVENVMEDIRSINALESDSLQVGQSIFLPTY
jgi:LysM domain.